MTNSTIRVDEVRNRIYLVLEGYHDVEEALRLQDLYREAIGRCVPGFTVLADVSAYRPGSEEVQKIHEACVLMADKGGVSRVARVVGGTPLGGMQIQRIAREKTSYQSANFETVEEAEAFLDREMD
ncbi:MAG TPA: hypothetical protein ENN03_10975 [bacterium]|nr:hypothetical protein [bacterium]